MKRTLLLVLLLGCASGLLAQNRLPLIHIKDTHSIGILAGTGWGNSVTVGLHYHYLFHRHWAFTTEIEYEIGHFEPSQFQSIQLYPGIEAAVWQPCSWLYIHLTGKLLVGYEFWSNPTIHESTQGWGVGCSLGGNLEFYALSQLSITLSAEEGWKYCFFPNQHENYFFPLFSLGIRYHLL